MADLSRPINPAAPGKPGPLHTGSPRRRRRRLRVVSVLRVLFLLLVYGASLGAATLYFAIKTINQDLPQDLTKLLEYQPYRKSIVLIVKEWNVPLYTRNFSWPGADAPQIAAELDDATLIEFYTFSDVQFRQQLAEADFDRKNEEYRFR